MAKVHDQIDPAGEEPVVFYSGEGSIPGAPARDLSGGDLARIVYERAHRDTEWERRDEDGNGPPLPGPATQHQLAKLVDELLATPVYRKTKPDHTPAIDTSTDQPAETAATPEG